MSSVASISSVGAISGASINLNNTSTVVTQFESGTWKPINPGSKSVPSTVYFNKQFETIPVVNATFKFEGYPGSQTNYLWFFQLLTITPQYFTYKIFDSQNYHYEQYCTLQWTAVTSGQSGQ